ncbi:soluble lamin-associated protein of 75 kDa isoform X1 [Callorhinchus milii]|uniref:soluble lamin-associated protein of 75 kDa isoform X1 n=1 Tax=Callorhinchus milii TaxID=7868 RepID=UPI001C3F58D7|nr:soluble lamin-associated protein of 75 kDa isoform X1 [Callorhinchus milii]XP_007903532.2 soluble lamin-associated protein of 75 kDa isoform X1 [Callorhinchus milii]XP_042190656.1 soluble lamin-associated protein of 75 kDa isoform X1 [Callorhinchus milii]XP_042190664.1 soluble lamin-associated protein of 75 kDa isoform X1 [Callorhinchus milii]
MAFPVDLLADLDHEDIEQSADEYMSDLLYGDPDKLEYFMLPTRRKIPISLSSVGFVPLYGNDVTHKVLALFAPEDQSVAVALYVVDRWWAIDDIVKTAEPSRQGLQQVNLLGERIVLYVLNRIIYRDQEMSADELPFLCHSATENAKILWKSGKAIGFYSIKTTGSQCNTFLTQCYQLPVLDTIFVRKKHRGKGYGLQMLEDFVDSFTEDMLGLKYPIPPSMYGVCRKYLENYPDDRDLLWEVEGIGHMFQRALIADRLQAQISAKEDMDIAQADQQQAASEETLSLPVAESELQTQLTEEMENEPKTMELSTDAYVSREFPVASSSVFEELTRPPVSKRGRSSRSKRPKVEKQLIEPEQKPLNNEEEPSTLEVPEEPLNSTEPNTEETENTAQTMEEQEECPVLQDSAENQLEMTPGDVLLCHIEVLEQEADEDKDFLLEPEPEPQPETVNGEVTDEATQESTKTEEEIPKDTVKPEEEIAEESVRDDEEEEEEEDEEEEEEEEVAEDAEKPEQEIAEDVTKDDEDDEITEESIRPEEEAANGGPSEQLDDEPEDPGATQELQDQNEVNEMEEDVEGAQDVTAQDQAAEADPVTVVEDNSSSSNHHASAPKEDHSAESTKEIPEPAKEEPSDNGHISVDEEVSQHCSLENEGISVDHPKTDSAAHESEQGESNAPMDLSRGPLILVELDDVSQKQTPSDEPKESDDLKSQPSPAVVEKTAESSSEETEMEVPVVDRRNLRRKGKANKGPPKKRSKVYHPRAVKRKR